MTRDSHLRSGSVWMRTRIPESQTQNAVICSRKGSPRSADTRHQTRIWARRREGGCRDAEKHEDEAETHTNARRVKVAKRFPGRFPPPPGRPGSRYRPEPARRRRGKERRPDRPRTQSRPKCWYPGYTPHVRDIRLTSPVGRSCALPAAAPAASRPHTVAVGTRQPPSSRCRHSETAGR